MKTVGFIDYFLNEWHANEYPAMIKEYNEKNGLVICRRKYRCPKEQKRYSGILRNRRIM
jgi:hypothetical protein